MNSMNVSSYRQLPRELEFEVFDFLPIEEQQRLVNLFKCSQAKIDQKIAARKKNRVTLMEAIFQDTQYLAMDRRCKLASMVNLSQSQVRKWFENRRARWKKVQRHLGRYLGPSPPLPAIDKRILEVVENF